MAKYIRKTEDVFEIQGYYGAQYGYECVAAEGTRKEAREMLKCYRENEPNTSFRIIKKREKI